MKFAFYITWRTVKAFFFILVSIISAPALLFAALIMWIAEPIYDWYVAIWHDWERKQEKLKVKK